MLVYIFISLFNVNVGMSAGGDEKICVLYYWDGNVIEDSVSVRYDRGPARYVLMDRSTSLEELRSRIFQARGLNSNLYRLEIQSPIFTKDVRGVESTILLEINDEESLSTICSPYVNNNNVVLYIKFNDISGEFTQGGVEVEMEGDDVQGGDEMDADDVQCDSYAQNVDELESGPEDVDGFEVGQDDDDDCNAEVGQVGHGWYPSTNFMQQLPELYD